MVHPTPNRLIRHRHSAFREQIFDVTQAEGKPEVEPYCLANDLGRETIPAVTDFLHPLGYSTTGRTATTTRRDNALWADLEAMVGLDASITGYCKSRGEIICGQRRSAL